MNESAKFTLVGFSALMAAVGLGAFGAHGLEKSLSEKSLATYQTGIEYLFYHGLGALALACLGDIHKISFKRSRIALMLGMLVFSGGCMAYAVSGQKLIAMAIPLGGLGYLFCWALALKELASKFKK
ncbi:MAG: DUF423 domain-containing protein [bacterium]